MPKEENPSGISHTPTSNRNIPHFVKLKKKNQKMWESLTFQVIKGNRDILVFIRDTQNYLKIIWIAGELVYLPVHE